MIDPLPIERVMREAVEARRVELGLNYVQLAERAGVDRGTIYNMLGFQTRGGTRMWQKVLDAVDVEIGWRAKESS